MEGELNIVQGFRWDHSSWGSSRGDGGMAVKRKSGEHRQQERPRAEDKNSAEPIYTSMMSSADPIRQRSASSK